MTPPTMSAAGPCYVDIDRSTVFAAGDKAISTYSRMWASVPVRHNQITLTPPVRMVYREEPNPDESGWVCKATPWNRGWVRAEANTGADILRLVMRLVKGGVPREALMLHLHDGPVALAASVGELAEAAR